MSRPWSGQDNPGSRQGTTQGVPGPGVGREHRLRILVVDDDEGCRLGIAAILGDDGHQLVVASRGEEAVEQARFLRRRNEGLDLSILDFHMPDLDGIETYRLLVEEFPGLPGLFVSGEASPWLEEQVRLVGGIGLVQKPLDVVRVRRIVYGFSAGGGYVVK